MPWMVRPVTNVAGLLAFANPSTAGPSICVQVPKLGEAPGELPAMNVVVPLHILWLLLLWDIPVRALQSGLSFWLLLH